MVAYIYLFCSTSSLGFGTLSIKQDALITQYFKHDQPFAARGPIFAPPARLVRSMETFVS